MMPKIENALIIRSAYGTGIHMTASVLNQRCLRWNELCSVNACVLYTLTQTMSALICSSLMSASSNRGSWLQCCPQNQVAGAADPSVVSCTK